MKKIVLKGNNPKGISRTNKAFQLAFEVAKQEGLEVTVIDHNWESNNKEYGLKELNEPLVAYIPKTEYYLNAITNFFKKLLF